MTDKDTTMTTSASSPAFTSPSSPFGGGTDLAALRAASGVSQRTPLAAPVTEDPVDPLAGLSAKERRQVERQMRRIKGKVEDYPHLMAIKPREGYLFRSDYFEIDDTVASILGFFHDDAAHDDFGAFWGINRIPSGLGDGVSVVVLEQMRRMGQRWIDERTSDTERLNRLESGEQDKTGTARSKRKAAKVATDVDIITDELSNGASYLHVHNRIIVRAPSLNSLDEALERIRRLYVDRFGTVTIAAYPGEQRGEMSSVFRRNDKKRGRGQHFTSTEFAGSHSLVTNGLNDPGGEYVGSMLGDVNNSAVLFDVNDYEHHVVVADAALNPLLNRAHVPDMWGSKISQSALLSNGRVVHLILDGADMDVLGPKLDGLTARLDMNSGDINMFEMFGAKEDELLIFPSHLQKIVLMAEQAYEAGDHERAIIRGTLEATLTLFYVDKRMWAYDAKHNRDKLRLVDLPHTQVPRMQDLVTYFETKYKALANSQARDDEMLHAYNVLRTVFTNLLNNNGDLFNTHTSDSIDGVANARRVLYDFSELLRRGKGVAMAQLVNTVGFAVDNLGLGDTVIVHGAENIDQGVKEYITTQFKRLYGRGGRVAFLYNDIDTMIADAGFNQFDRADWTVLGPMTESTVAAYQKKLGQDIPPDLERLVTTKGQSLAYLRRDVTNVVFHLDLALGINPARAAQRARIDAERQRQLHSEAVGSQLPAGYVTQEQYEQNRQRRALPSSPGNGRPVSVSPQRSRTLAR